MRAYIPLTHGLSASNWCARHALGEVPDASPYGLHKLTEHQVDVTFGETSFGRTTELIARSIRYRTSGVELLEGLAESHARRSRDTDVVLTYDERTGIPASLLRTPRHAPVLLGVAWLTDRATTPWLHASLAGTALARAAAVWGQCAPALPALGREWRIPESRLYFVPLGIDTEFYGLQPEAESANIVVSAGEDRYRDHALLVAAVASLRTRYPDIRLELATELPVDMPNGLGVVHRARLDGRMRHLYRNSSVVAIALKPTLNGSGLTVALEAMSSGRPVVMTGNPGISDYIEHGVTGLLVPPDDVEAFAAAIGELLADPMRRAEMGAAGARRARERFTSGGMAGALAALMRSI